MKVMQFLNGKQFFIITLLFVLFPSAYAAALFVTFIVLLTSIYASL